MIYFFLALLAAFWLAVTFAPALGRARAESLDSARADLEEERDLIYRQLEELEPEQPSDGTILPELERERLRLKVRAARVLTELDTLPPKPQARVLEKRATPTVVGVAIAVVAALVIGLFTFLSSWQQKGLTSDYTQLLKTSARVSALEQKAKSGDVKPLLELADAYFDLSRVADAARAYGTVLQKNPKEPRALRRFGLLLALQPSKVSQGLGLLELSTQVAPQEPEGFLLLGSIYRQLGQFDKAVVALERYKKLTPNGREADALLAQLQPGTQLLASRGSSLYTQNCAGCHGAQGQGGSAPSLQESAVLVDKAALESIIVGGKGAMAGYPKIQGTDLKQLTQFVQTLKK